MINNMRMEPPNKKNKMRVKSTKAISSLSPLESSLLSELFRKELPLSRLPTQFISTIPLILLAPLLFSTEL